MTKPQTNFILDMAQLTLIIFVATSGLILWLVLPCGGGQGGDGYGGGYYDDSQTQSFILERNTWKDIHVISALTLGAMVFIHIILHLNWIQTMLRKQTRR
jgi:hypothetical protein